VKTEVRRADPVEKLHVAANDRRFHLLFEGEHFGGGI
jgi:hypothetical protein